jgi:hypothetical protein
MLWLIGGRDPIGAPSAFVDLVHWQGDSVVIEPGPDLSTPRAGAAAFEHASGIVTVAGGDGLASFEECFPPALDPL